MNQLPGAGHTFLKLTRSFLGGALVLALGLGLGSTKVRATTDTWISNSGTFGDNANWDTGLAPIDGDVAVFTNETSITVSLGANTPLLRNTIISNHTGVVTINPNNFTWQVTNAFRVGVCDSTSTVYLAGGTLAAAGATAVTGQLRIGDAVTNVPNFNCVGILVVSNGTVAADAGIVGASSNSVGTLIIYNNGVYTDGGTGSGSTLTIGANSGMSRLIITNGGQLSVDGTITVGNNLGSTNNFMLLSGPTSRGTITAAGDLKFNGTGGQLIISNGAKLFQTGSLLFGGSCNANTGVVTGVGTSVIISGSLQVGLGAAGATNNLFTVQDGAFLSCGGTFAYGNNGQNVSNGVNFGGTGLMSTGLFTVIRSASNNTNHFNNFMTISNAFVACNYLNPQGPQETFAILSKGTLKLTNSISIPVPAGNSNSVSMGGSAGATGGSFFIINGGTLDNLLTADNVGGITLGGSFGYNSLIITNGGKLLTSMGTIGAGTSFNTGIVSGVSSVWSNFSGPVGFTNALIVGANAGSSNGNYLSVSDGGSLFDAGNLLVGNSATSAVNTVALGGPGAVSTINIQGALRVGSFSGTSNNQVTVNNATVTCGSIFVGQPTVFVANLTFTTNANSLVVTNFCTSTNGLIVASVLTNCTPTVSTNTAFNVMTISSGTVTAGLIRVVGSNTLVYSGGTLLFTNLQVDGIMTGAATVNVPNGSTLQGIGSVANPVTVANGGIIAPGDSVGTLTISNNLVLNTTSVLNYEMGSTANADKLAVVGNLTLDGMLNITTNNISGTFGVGNYTLITYTGTLTDIGLIPPTPFPGLAYTIVAGGGSVVLQVTSGGTDPFISWQDHYFPADGPNATGNADPDHDGMSNTNEFLAGFSPTNNSDYVHITGISKINGGADIQVDYLGASGDSTYSGGPASRTNVLEFTAGTGGNYNSNTFASTGQTNILSGGVGHGMLTNMVDPGGATASPSRYYRVRVLVP